MSKSIDGRLDKLEIRVDQLTRICLFEEGGQAEFYTNSGEKVKITNEEFENIRQQLTNYIFENGQPVAHKKLDDILAAESGIGLYLKAIIGDRHQKN